MYLRKAMMISEDIIIVIAPSVLSIIASQRNQISEPPVAKLTQLNQKRYIKYKVKCIDLYKFLCFEIIIIILNSYLYILSNVVLDNKVLSF